MRYRILLDTLDNTILVQDTFTNLESGWCYSDDVREYKIEFIDELIKRNNSNIIIVDTTNKCLFNFHEVISVYPEFFI